MSLVQLVPAIYDPGGLGTYGSPVVDHSATLYRKLYGEDPIITFEIERCPLVIFTGESFPTLTYAPRLWMFVVTTFGVGWIDSKYCKSL